MYQRLRHYPLWAWTLLAVSAILLARSWTAWAYPILAAEDGTILFSRFRRDPSPRGMFDFYSGYISLLPGIAGYIASLLPARWTPYAMGAFAGIVSVFAYSVFALPRFRPLVASDAHRAGICLLMAILPVANSMLLSSDVYSLWNLLWLLIALNLFSESQSRSVRWAQFLLSALAIWSHPLSVVLIPFLIWRWRKHDSRPERQLALALLVTLGLYFVFGVRSYAGQEGRDLLAAMSLLPGFLTELVFFEALVGPMVPGRFSSGSLWAIVLGGFVFGVVLWISVRIWPTLDGRRKQCLIRIALLVPILSLACIYSRAFHDRPGYAVPIRYAYIQRLLWLPVLFALLLSGVNRLRPDAQKLAIAGLVALALLSARANQSMYEVAAGESLHLARFLQEVEEWEAAGKPAPAPYYYRPGWHIRFDDEPLAVPGR